MLLAMHGMLVWFDQNLWLRDLFFCFAVLCFLAWQPLAAQQSNNKQPIFNIEKNQWLGIGIVTLFLSYVLNWWLCALFMSIVFGLVGGRILSKPSTSNRMVHILAASYLLAMLLVWVVPKLLTANDNLMAAEYVINYLMPLIPLAIIVLQNNDDEIENAPIFDFFYALILSMLAIIIVLGSYILGSFKQINYLLVMFYAIFALALVLFAFSYIWRVNNRFSGAELLMSRYLLSVGMPFEQWVKNIATLAEHEAEPTNFVQSAMLSIMRLEWVSGVRWKILETEGELGENEGNENHFQFKNLSLTLISPWPLSPALYVHTTLLTQIMGEFYEAKRREITLRQHTYMQAFYETGSRLTHDIKNILQSLGGLVSAAQQAHPDDHAELIKLIQRQLPMLNQRIASTLDKLKAPSEAKQRFEKATAWWKALCLRYSQPFISFHAELMPTFDINGEVLDSILDNLLSNAIEKSKHEPNLLIQVHLTQEEGQFEITVKDNGSAIRKDVARRLFNQHINSSNGLGVGLFHAAQDAEQAGYHLQLSHNLRGDVCFSVQLTQHPSEQDAAELR